MRIDRDGYPFIAMGAVPAVLAGVARRPVWALGFAGLAGALGAFFRDPDRSPDRGDVDDDIVLAPADGKVMYAGPGQEGVAPPGDWQQVSIFLSVADVHINRTPYGGTVTDVAYRPGKFHAAFKAESAHHNERSEITVRRVVDGQERIVVFRQIVGVLARRVVTRVNPGQQITTGERIGLMKFGSRMDVFVPLAARVMVVEGKRVRAGETVLARFGQPEPSTVVSAPTSHHSEHAPLAQGRDVDGLDQ